MWENETVVLITSLKKRLLKEKNIVRYQKIAADDGIPKFIKNLFRDKINKYIVEESPFEFKSTPHFELKTKNISDLKEKSIEICWDAAIFKEKEFEEILNEALVLRLNYMIKPIDTMRRLLFETNENIALNDMTEIFNSFKKILPYSDLIIKECSRTGKSLVDKEIFSRIAAEQIQNVIKKDPIKIILKDISVLNDFLSETKGETIDHLEGMMLQEFLADRNLWDFHRALEVEIKLGKEVFSSEDLEITLKRYVELKNEFEKPEKIEILKEEKKTEPTTVETDIQETVQEEETLLEVQEEETLLEVQEEETLLEVEEENNDMTETKKGADLNWELEDISIEKKKKNEKKEQVAAKKTVKKTEEEPDNGKQKHMRIIRRDPNLEDEMEQPLIVKEKEPGKATLGLKSLIDLKLEKSFIKKLFDGNSKAYEDVINKLDSANSWRDAKILIDNELFKRDIDPFSREAIKLVDIVYGIFYPEEGVGGKL